MPQDYNSTLNLPKTEFPMRAGLPQREPELLKKWDESRVYQNLIEQNKGKPKYILHDGPPYANGDIHMGTAMNKVLKDIVVKYKNMSGFCSPYVPGWDTHGLPIELQAIKAYGIDRSNVNTVEFRRKCRDFAIKYMDNQRKQFKRLGVLGEWENPYLTLAPEFEAKQIKVFGAMAKKGYIYKGLKPVYWCPHDETALAEAEIEYSEDKCESIYVKFKVKDDKGKLSKITGGLNNLYFVIWTTTTWTLPGNLAIALNPECQYILAKTPDNEIYIIAKDLAESAMKLCGIKAYETLLELKGSDFEFMTAEHPFLPRDSVVVMADYVTLESGTGCVHTAPGHGLEDFATGQKYKLPILVPVDNKGYMTKEAGKFEGLYYEKANNAILEELVNNNRLLSKNTIQHTYPHCWRCKEPVIFRATEQWFASVNAIKEDAINACHDIEWLPNWGEERMVGMIGERSDWCISRQRVWGVPIPIFYCQKCNKELITDDTINAVADLFEKSGSDAWYEKETEEILPKGTVCPVCGNETFIKESDIMDVWFDSGSTHEAVLKTRENLRWPADMYLEGADQYRGWFQSSLLTAIAVSGKAPYKTVLTHGWVVDGEGRKMSKSIGNTIYPGDVIKEYGADILRLWVASSDYRVDVRISKEMFKQISQIYLKIRNTARYILGNLYDFNPDDLVSYDKMSEIDRFALMKLNELSEKVIRAYEQFEYHIVYHAVHNFCVVDMSNFYLDIIKDRLYCEKSDSLERKSAQSAMYLILDSLVRLIAPILAFTSDEIWQAMPHHEGVAKENIVFNEIIKPSSECRFGDELKEKWQRLMSLRDDVNAALEIARTNKLIGKPLEAEVTVWCRDDKDYEFINAVLPILKTVFIVSNVNVNKGEHEGFKCLSLTNSFVEVQKAAGGKCERCWTYSDSVGKNSAHPSLCDRCSGVL